MIRKRRARGGPLFSKNISFHRRRRSLKYRAAPTADDTRPTTYAPAVSQKPHWRSARPSGKNRKKTDTSENVPSTVKTRERSRSPNRRTIAAARGRTGTKKNSWFPAEAMSCPEQPAYQGAKNANRITATATKYTASTGLSFSLPFRSFIRNSIRTLTVKRQVN
jgi:hypothetical protein